jgi:crotonobetainyl-CoA:carnitine CoA-transferase CaiB-like acyl-CoA transferase
MILADQGADVIKVEQPPKGDLTRAVATSRGGFSASFLNNNRNKRSVALDLKTPRGLAALRALIPESDVVIQNFRPKVAERLGVGEEALRALAPALVYVSISGFGERGPYAQKPTYDPLVQALSGLTTIQAGSDERRPRLVRTILPDKVTALTCAQAVAAALLHRERTGEGQHVRLSMLDAVIAFLWASDMGSQTFVGDSIAPERAQSFIDLIYETSDGYITVAVQSDKEWEGLCRALERPEWLDDERFRTPALRHEHIDARLGQTQEVLRGRSSADWLARLEAADVPCAPILRRRDMVAHPQVVENAILVETEHPQAGHLRQARSAARFSTSPPEHRFGAPLLGEHGREVLSQCAGLSEEEIDSLIADGILYEASSR